MTDITRRTVKNRWGARHHARLLAVLFLVWSLSSMNNQLYPLVYPSILKEWSLAYTNLGFISSIVLTSSILGPLTFGAFADYFGRKKLLAISVLGIGLTCLSSLSQDWLQLAITLAVGCFASYGVFPLVFSMASEELPPEGRGFGISIIASGYGVGGGILAGSVAGFLIPISWKLVFLVEVVPCILVALAIAKFVPESGVWMTLRAKEDGRNQASTWNMVKGFRPLRVFKSPYRRKFVVAILVGCFANLLWTGVAQWIAIFLVAERKMPTEFAAIWFALFGLFGVFGSWINGLCADKLGRKPTILVFFISTGLSILALVLLARSETDFLLAAVPMGVAFLGLYPTTFTVTSELLPSEARAGGTALRSVLLAPMTILLPYLIGVGATYYSFAFCFSVISIFVIVSSPLLFCMMPESRGEVF